MASDIKARFRKKLTALSARLGAKKPERLGDALMLLFEGVYCSGQVFGAGGPSRVLMEAAEMLIDAHGGRD